MAEAETTETTSAEGQSAGPETGTPAAPTDTAGESGSQSAGTTVSDPGGEESFFDPKAIQDKPELMSAYKEMQRAFTKKMENIKAARQKIEAFDAFNQDPVGQMQKLAQRMGYSLTRAEAAQQIQNQQQNWEPQTWEEVNERATQAALERIRSEFAPIMDQVTTMRRSNVERLLDDNCPDWRVYEDEMMGNLQSHPSLVNDPVKLYRLSVPYEVMESRATQAALKKLQGKVEGSKLSGPSTTTKKPLEGLPDKPLSFSEAVEAAKSHLEKQGITLK